MDLLERLFYAVARGIARAWFDELDERKLAEREMPDVEDRIRARVFHNAVDRVQRRLPPGDTGPIDPASGGGGSAQGSDLGKAS